MRKLLGFFIIALILMSSACGKLPQKGDHVQVVVTNGAVSMVFDGIVTDLKDGLLGLNCSFSKVLGSDNPDRRVHDICIGVGSIAQLQWMDDKGNAI